MKLFVVVYILGVATGLVGPFDDKATPEANLNACQSWIDQNNPKMAAAWDDPVKVEKMLDVYPGLSKSDVNFKCKEVHTEKLE